MYEAFGFGFEVRWFDGSLGVARHELSEGKARAAAADLPEYLRVWLAFASFYFAPVLGAAKS